MRKIKTRYKVLMADIILTILFYFSFAAYIKFFNHKSEDVPDLLGAITDAIFYLYQYCWIILLCIVSIVYGIFKKNNEFFWGGIYSLIFSGLVIILILKS